MSINFHLQIITGLWLWISCTEMTASALSSGVASPCEPRNTTVVVGSSVSFSCCFSTCTAKYFRWFWYGSRSEKDIIYSFYGELNTKYDGIIFITFPNGLDALGGKSVLSIHRSHYNNSGRYQCTCFDNNNDEINRTMELVVIGTDLNNSCKLAESSFLENNTYEVKCNLLFNATTNVLPRINCYTETTRSNTTIPMDTYRTQDNKKGVRYGGNFTAAVDQVVTCNLLISYANSQPFQLVSNWSIVPNILFAVRDISIHPKPNHAVIYPGDKIYCEARGNPKPVYYWLDPSTGLETVGQQYMPDWCRENDTVILSRQKTMVCVAQNVIHGTVHRVTKLAVFSLPPFADLRLTCATETGCNLLTTAVKALSVIAGVLLCAFIVTVSILAAQNKRLRSRLEQKSELTTDAVNVSHADQQNYQALQMMRHQERVSSSSSTNTDACYSVLTTAQLESVQ